MASSSSSLAEKEKQHGVSEEDSAAFCLRIFSREDLKDGKKELPPAAVREYGHQMADHMFLKVPNCGEHWKIELRASPRRDRMWLEKGWEEFASFYLLDQGDMATFSFEGKHSHFHVSIYSWDDMEIKYPIRSGGVDASPPERKEIGTEAVAIAISSSPRSPATVHVRRKDRVRRRRRQTGFEAEARAISVSPRCLADEHEYDTSQMSSFRSDKPFLDIRIPAKTLSFHVEAV